MNAPNLLFIDTEFNGHGGELISIGIAAANGRTFYGICDPPSQPPPWVRDHVLPRLYGRTPQAVGTSAVMRSFKRFMLDHAFPPPTIVADWPSDLKHLSSLMDGPNYPESVMIGCTIRLIHTPDGLPISTLPHNALADACALKTWAMVWRKELMQ